MIAIVFFEGSDVIDLPTSGLKREGDVIFVPDQVARGLFASEEPWITNQSVARAASLLYGGRPDPRNLLVGVRRSDNPTEDVKVVYGKDTEVVNSIRTADTASNALVVTGDPKYISYVSIDRPIFRDVIITKVNVQVSGLSTALAGLSATDTSFDEQGKSYMLRFAWVNLAAEGEDQRMGWRLSQSLGVTPSSGQPVLLPNDVLKGFSTEDKALESTYLAGKHYAYNLADDGPDTSGTKLDIVPAKQAFDPFVARDMSDENSPYFDRNAVFKFIEPEPGFGSAGLTDQYAVGIAGVGGTSIGGASPTPVPEFGYTSPHWKLNLTSKTRMIMEYAVRAPHGLNLVTSVGFRRYPALIGTLAGTSDLQILANSVESKGGVIAVNDCCTYLTKVYDVTSVGLAGMLVERQFDDITWQTNIESIPSSKSKKFMMGEFPFRTDGRPLFLPEQRFLSFANDGSIDIESDDYVTSLLLSAEPASNADAFNVVVSKDGSGDPLFEASLGDTITSADSPQILLGVPGLRFEGYNNGGGMRLLQVFGAKTGDPLLGPFGGSQESASEEQQEAKLLAYSDAQLSKVEAQTWPVESNNVSATSDCASGLIYLAFENGNRIDMAIGDCAGEFSMIRDVVLRIPDDTDARKESSNKGGDDNLPPATLPFLFNDGEATRTLFMLYSYKDKVLCKNIPMELMSKPKENGSYQPQVERDISQSLHKTGATLVYDGAGDVDDASKSGSTTGIFLDIEAGAISVSQDQDDPNPDTAGRPEQASQYSAFVDSAGYLFCFIQAGDKIVVRRSIDLSGKWSDALPRGFMFIPETKTDEDSAEGTTTTEPDGSSPSVLYDNATQDVLLFMTIEQSLVYSKFPGEILRNKSDAAAAALEPYRNPKLLFGEMSTDMLGRGITPAIVVNEVEDKSESSNRIQAQRVSAIKSTQGYYRVFFKDEDRRLRSMVSFDMGGTWRHVDEIRGEVQG
jgi:hypothetical protein